MLFVFLAVNVNPSTPKTKLILLHYSHYTFPWFSNRRMWGFISGSMCLYYKEKLDVNHFWAGRVNFLVPFPFLSSICCLSYWLIFLIDKVKWLCYARSLLKGEQWCSLVQIIAFRKKSNLWLWVHLDKFFIFIVPDTWN